MGIKQECVVGARQLVAEPAGSQGARLGQPHEPQLIHTANAMHTHRAQPARLHVSTGQSEGQNRMCV